MILFLSYIQANYSSPSPFCVKELYQQVLAKALAHYFEAKLLLLDLTDFSLKVSVSSIGVIFCLLLLLFYIMVGLSSAQIQSRYGFSKESVSFCSFSFISVFLKCLMLLLEHCFYVS